VKQTIVIDTERCPRYCIERCMSILPGVCSTDPQCHDLCKAGDCPLAPDTSLIREVIEFMDAPLRDRAKHSGQALSPAGVAKFDDIITRLKQSIGES
jgi:hypothetical protein